MSRTSSTYIRRSAYRALDCRALDEIQRDVIKQGKRNAVSRLFRAEDDKEKIAARRLELNRILHVFNVRSFTSVRQSLTVHLQTELAMNTNLLVSDVHRDVVNTNVTMSEVRKIVFDMYRTMAKSQEGSDGRSQLVSVPCTLFITESTLTVS